MDEKLSEFEIICKPVVEFLRKNYNPHSRVIISDDRAELLSGEIGIPYLDKEND